MAADAPGYHDHLRAEVLDLLPPRPRRVLEVGCAAGVSGAAIRRRHPACEVIGVELDAGAAGRAAARLDRVLVGDVERLDLEAAGIGAGTLDAILYADVLEHLRDPWALVRRHAALLADGGWVVASLPNVRYCEVLLGLLRGTWTYADAGVLDRGHLRFFTRHEGERLLADAGLRVVGTRAIYWQPPAGEPPAGRSGDTAWIQLEEFRISGLAPDAVDELRAGQIVYAAAKGEPVLPWAFPGAHGFRFLLPPGGDPARALAAWAEAFLPGDDVALVLTADADALPAVEGAVRAALARAGRSPETTADVIVELAATGVGGRRRQLRAVDALIAAGAVDATLAAEAARAGGVPIVAADPDALRAACARMRAARPAGETPGDAPRAEGAAG
jgi:SAM-dependent methyltransferase